MTRSALFDSLVHCPFRLAREAWPVVVAVIAATLLGCGGAPFTVAPAADGAELSSEAGDLAGPEVNAFPGTPYAPAMCRSGADCVGNVLDLPDGSVPIQAACVAFEGVGANVNSPILNGETRCDPLEDVSHGEIVLCLSDLDCNGYSCVTEECVVAT